MELAKFSIYLFLKAQFINIFTSNGILKQTVGSIKYAQSALNATTVPAVEGPVS